MELTEHGDRLGHLLPLASLPCSQAPSGAQSETTHRGACRGPSEGLEWSGKMGANMEQMFHNLNLRTVILQGESYLKKRKKKKLTGFSGIVFSVYT